MPRRPDLSSVLVIGSGPIVIGQAAEFDYSGTQACRVLREEGLRVILVNSNPATIMTDPDIADATYIEPTDPQIIRTIIDGVDWVNADDMEFLSSTMTPEDSSQNWGVGVMIGDQVNGTDVLDVDVKNGWLPDEEGWWYINSMGAVILPEAAYSVAVAAKGFPDEQTGYDAASEMVRAYFTAKFSD